MHTTALGTALSAIFFSATTSPTKREEIYHGIGLTFVVDVPGQRYTQSPAPIEINVLADTTGGSASTLMFDTVAAHINLDTVECRAYSDSDGVVPLSRPFSKEHPAVLSTTEVVPVGSILCYVVTPGEAAGS